MDKNIPWSGIILHTCNTSTAEEHRKLKANLKYIERSKNNINIKE